MYDYALMLKRGQGGPVDLVGARKWFQEATIRGYAPAMYHYAVLLYDGQGGAVDLVGARKWYLEAAQKDILLL